MTTTALQNITLEIVRISKEIGAWMKLQTSVSEQNAELKTENNLVTYVDKESERRFVAALSTLLPEAGFVAEEGTGEKKENGMNWVIDPLDGTTNFVHRVPVWCTSVGLCDGNEPIVGVIYDPNTNECYSAWKGGGAWLNDERIAVSKIETLSSSLIATGFPYDDFGRENQYLQLLKEMTHATRGMRRLGSAALDMAWTACGRFEAFYEYGLNPWDVAAGTVIVREAGGLCTEFAGGNNPVFGDDMICSNGQIHAALMEVVKKYFP
ncbi:MAG: inositol monophosphatase family protein [Flavobacteriales bacterium]